MTLNDENISLYADTLVRQMAAGSGGGRTLDYSLSSLGILEELLRVSEKQIAAPGFPENQRNMLVFYTGCYVGEVLARQYGGAWKFEEKWIDSSLIFPLRGGTKNPSEGVANPPESGIQAFPFHKSHRRIVEGAIGNDLVDYGERLAEQFAKARQARAIASVKAAIEADGLSLHTKISRESS